MVVDGGVPAVVPCGNRICLSTQPRGQPAYPGSPGKRLLEGVGVCVGGWVFSRDRLLNETMLNQLLERVISKWLFD